MNGLGFRVYKFSLLRTSFLFLLFLHLGLASGQNIDVELWKQIDSLKYQASLYSNTNLDSSELLIDQAFGLLEEPIDTSIYADLLGDRGYYFQIRGIYDSAMHYYLKALKMNRAVADSLHISHSLAYLANLTYFTNDYENCRSYLKESIGILDRISAKGGDFANRYNVLALTYFDEDQLDSALHYFKIGLNYLDEDSASRSSTYVTYYDNIGQVLELKEQYHEADLNYRKSLAITVMKGWNDDILWTFNRMINVFLSQNQYDSAKKYIQLSREYLPRSADKEIQKDIIYSEAFYYAKVYNKDSLSKKLQDYGRLSEELIEARTAANIQEISAKYELEKNAAALALAEATTARFAEENKNQRTLLIIAVLGLIFLAVAIAFLRNFYHQRRKLSLMELEIKDNKLDELMSAQESKTYAAMLKGQQQERERIARDLHDRLGGTLAALKHSLRSPENKIKAEDLEIVDQAVKEVRDVSHNLASTQFADFGLNEALSQLKSTIEKVGEVKFDVYLHPSTSKLEQKVTIELYRIVQELLSNTLKHAQANTISVQTNFTDNVFNLIYEDNGRGFDLKKVSRGMGLDNMRARVKRIGGILNIDTEIGRGTIVIIELNQKS